MPSKLNPNEALLVNTSLTSPDGRFSLSLQSDGNLVLYGPTWEPLWSSGTYGKPVAKAIMQADGNFVIYSPDNTPVWSSRTVGYAVSELRVQNDGNVVIYDAAAKPKPLWTIPDFINIKNLIAQLIQLKTAPETKNKKIAFVFSGGGARAAWFGGVLEAIEREVRMQQPNVPANLRFSPDLLVGTSGGGLAAVGYFADLLNSRENKYGAYFNRQSWLWREISRGNEAALLLLDNPGVLELLSGSMTEKGQINWETIKDKPLATILKVANMPNPKSPTYNFNQLIKSFREIGADVKLIKTKWGALYTALTGLYNAAKTIINRIPQDIKAPWIDIINSVKNDIGGIKDNVEKVRGDIDFIRGKLTDNPPKVGKAMERVDDLFKDGGGVIASSVSGLIDISNKLATIPIGTIATQFSDFKTLFADIKNVLQKLDNINASFGNAIGDLAGAIIEFGKSIDDVISFIIAAGKMIDTNSSLMNNTGLKNALHEVLRMAIPQTFQNNGEASELDKAIFSYWEFQRGKKLLDPRVRAPELILTAANISANRLVLLTLCDGQTVKNLAAAKRWVIGLNLESSAFIGGKKLSRGPQVNPTNKKDPHHWIFGAWPNNYRDPVAEKVNPDIALLNANELTENKVTITPANPGSPGPMQKKALGGNLPDSPFEHKPGTTLINGNSLIAGAAITTATIPIAFPPKLWRFENKFLQKTYYHWFVDGGLCDNRPIQQALDAGADYIVSFELTPLRKAVIDIPAVAKKPKIMGVISALTDTQINSAFYRFLETYVENNQDTEKKLWRLAPEVAAGEEDETIGVYDFNGFWNKGQMKMGLFDWYMRGYLDAEKRIPASQSPDPVKEAYKNMPDYGQIGNAELKKSSQGFFIVDFKSNKPHPGY